MTITLTKDMGANDLDGVTRLEVGAGWDQTAGATRGPLGIVKRKVGTDLDLIAILKQGNDPVRFAGLDSLDPIGNGSVVHSGDNQTGKGSGDDETVTLDLAKVPGNVTSIVFVAAAYKKGTSLDKATNVSFKIYDSSDGTKTAVADIWPPLNATGNACAVCKVERAGTAWALTVLGEIGRVTQGDQRSLMNFAIGK